MTGSPNYNNIPTAWVDGELRLVGLDSRMIGLLRAIDQSGSINQAAKQMGLSYKGAWQIIERANNGAPKTLVSHRHRRQQGRRHLFDRGGTLFAVAVYPPGATASAVS